MRTVLANFGYWFILILVKYVVLSVPTCDTVQYMTEQTFRKNVLPQSSGQNSTFPQR